MTKEERLAIGKKRIKEIKRQNIAWLIPFFIGFLMGVSLFLLATFTETPSYENLKSDTVIVEKIKYNNRMGRRSDYYTLISSDGRVYNLSGEYDIDELREKLVKGEKISIKWFRGNILQDKRTYIKEIVHNGRVLMSYRNDDKSTRIVLYSSAFLLSFFGISSVFVYRSNVAQEIRKIPKSYLE